MDDLYPREEQGLWRPSLEEYPPIDRLSYIGKYKYDDTNRKLLEATAALHRSINQSRIYVDMEGAEIFRSRLDDAQLAMLNTLRESKALEPYSGVELEREERPPGYEHYCEKDGIEQTRYDNPWGDMTLMLRLESTEVATTYTISVYMETGLPQIGINQHVTPNQRPTSELGRLAEQLLGKVALPVLEETAVNKMGDDEYHVLFDLISDIQLSAS